MRQTEADEIQASHARHSSVRPVSFPDVLLYRGRASDGEECLATFDNRTVLLSRLVGGLPCRIRVSVSQYQAVAAIVRDEGHVIRLMHTEAGLSVDLAVIEDFEQAEDYRDRLAAFLGLPSVTMAGGRPTAYPNAATLTGGRTRLMKRRRPRFLTRRHKGELIELRRLERHEIIARG